MENSKGKARSNSSLPLHGLSQSSWLNWLLLSMSLFLVSCREKK